MNDNEFEDIELPVPLEEVQDGFQVVLLPPGKYKLQVTDYQKVAQTEKVKESIRVSYQIVDTEPLLRDLIGTPCADLFALTAEAEWKVRSFIRETLGRVPTGRKFPKEVVGKEVCANVSTRSYEGIQRNQFVYYSAQRWEFKKAPEVKTTGKKEMVEIDLS